MRTCAITASRNEADIIESFVRVNAHLIDRFYFMDDSTDNTRLILSKLTDEGLPIEIYRAEMPEYRQDTMTTSAIRDIAKSHDYDWFIMLDSDEFLTWKTREQMETALSRVGPAQCVALPWSTFIPQNPDYFGLRNPIYQAFRPRVPEVSHYCKVFVPKRLAPEIRMAVGNHSASLADGRPADTVQLADALAHVPVRSREQMILKAIIAVRVLEMKVDRHQGEGFHIVEILNMFKEKNFDIDFTTLQRIAFGYAIADPRLVPNSIDPSVTLGGAHTQLRYPELCKINVIATLDEHISFLSQMVLSYRKADALRQERAASTHTSADPADRPRPAG